MQSISILDKHLTYRGLSVIFYSTATMLKLIVSALLLATTALSATIDGLNFCVGTYALCSTSTCQSIPGNSSYVTCACEGPFDGLNVGNTTCKERSSSLISTFSLLEEFTSPTQPPLYSFECKGDNAGEYAVCLDAPCSTESGAVICTCPTYKGANFYLGEQCPKDGKATKEICSKIRSTGSASSSLTQLKTLFGSFYGIPPSAKNCISAS